MAPACFLRYSGIQDLATSSEMSSEMEQRARRVADRAVSNAPRDSGDYAESIAVETDQTDRALARVTADVPYALKVESRHRTLGEALDAAREG